jgi:AraC family transcriptional regulator
MTHTHSIQTQNYSIQNILKSVGATALNTADFGESFRGCIWQRHANSHTTYQRPNHHTLSFYRNGGTGIRRLDNSTQHPKKNGRPGICCLMPSEKTTDWDVTGFVEFFHLYIPKHTFKDAVLHSMDVDPDQVELKDIAFFTDPLLQAMMTHVFFTKDWQSPHDQLVLSHAGHVVVHHLLQNYSSRKPKPIIIKGGLAPRAQKRVQEYVAENLDKSITINQMAAVAGLSPYHFARMFKQSFGVSPHSFVMDQRIRHAQTLLGTTDKPLSEIANICGFSSQSHFTARFKDYTDVTPKLYRQSQC